MSGHSGMSAIPPDWAWQVLLEPSPFGSAASQRRLFQSVDGMAQELSGDGWRSVWLESWRPNLQVERFTVVFEFDSWARKTWRSRRITKGFPELLLTTWRETWVADRSDQAQTTAWLRSLANRGLADFATRHKLAAVPAFEVTAASYPFLRIDAVGSYARQEHATWHADPAVDRWLHKARFLCDHLVQILTEAALTSRISPELLVTARLGEQPAVELSDDGTEAVVTVGAGFDRLVENEQRRQVCDDVMRSVRLRAEVDGFDVDPVIAELADRLDADPADLVMPSDWEVDPVGSGQVRRVYRQTWDGVGRVRLEARRGNESIVTSAWAPAGPTATAGLIAQDVDFDDEGPFIDMPSQRSGWSVTRLRL
ncbi:hypothetical protein FHX74_001570 [Friedmanniella endophytica]|uniref:Uncharacterized protein n=1 Tax=Microlunatus kandeliicorticis TaxID=1759536 RepID=A0A7W3P5K6_9ACTN|nr:hypothetical protein [Microlunatus kandeliicorticis]MBA8793965.1 hypothetical protein [Microlunatus kandeliicorticis]